MVEASGLEPLRFCTRLPTDDALQSQKHQPASGESMVQPATCDQRICWGDSASALFVSCRPHCKPWNKEMKNKQFEMMWVPRGVAFELIRLRPDLAFPITTSLSFKYFF